MATCTPPSAILLAVLSVTLALAQGVQVLYESGDVFNNLHSGFNNRLESTKSDIESLRAAVSELGRQTMLQQFAVEERIRTGGNSGVKQVRGFRNGPMNYYQAAHHANQMLNCHDHCDHMLTIGMGEFEAVLNGVEFRTRHNDYLLKMKSQTSSIYNDTVDIEFPDVPIEVTSKPTIQEQIVEMREWFKAFHEQNYTERDYRQYFKPVMCYMEGAWTLDEDLSEPFESDRHFIDAESWFDLQEKNRYEAYTGQKTKLENLAYLPTQIAEVDKETGQITYAKWTYRILCHPINRDIPTKYFRPLEDLSSRLPYTRSFESHANSRSVRFVLYEKLLDDFEDYSLLDEIFYTIPGMNNMADNLTSEIMDPIADQVYDVTSEDPEQPTTLKVGYYHRKYMFKDRGAMGLREATRGFSDANMFTARTTQEKIAPIRMHICERLPETQPDGSTRYIKTCGYKTFRSSYAIPLEVIYLTPLWKWNPHNVTHFETEAEVIGDPGTQTGKLGKPYFGVANKYFYQTPAEFFTDAPITDLDPADTTKTGIFVMDQFGQPQSMRASGTYIRTPPIHDVGRVRMRYPIAPIHGEGSSVWKELNALRQLLSDERVMEGWTNNYKFEMAPTSQDPPGFHSHEFVISKDALFNLIAGTLSHSWVTTETSHNHDHYIRVKYNSTSDSFFYDRCGSNTIYPCWDNHPPDLSPLENLDRVYEEVEESKMEAAASEDTMVTTMM